MPAYPTNTATSDMSSRTLYLHVGYPKTATTHLQRRVFSALGSVTYRDKPTAPKLFHDTVRKGYYYGVLDRAFKRSPVVWDTLGDEILREAVGPNTPTHRPVLISDEGVTSQLDPYTVSLHYRGFSAAAGRAGFDDVRVLCVVRRQDQWLGSAYAQTSDRRPGARQDGFVEHVREMVDLHRGYFTGGVTRDYITHWDALTKTFGREHVRFLAYESLLNDTDEFHSDILAFLEADEADREAVARALADTSGRDNRRSTSADTWEIRRSQPVAQVTLRPGRLFRRLGLPGRLDLRIPDVRRGDHIEMTDSLRALVLARYGRSNRALAEATGLDLGRFGYYDA